MVAKTEEQKQAEADAKTEQEQQEQREAAAKAADENLGKLGAAQSVAQAAGVVNQERQNTQIGERQAAISVGNDPETADDEGGSPVEQGPFAGQLVATQHYAAATTEFQGRQVVEVRPEGWVGPGFEFPARRVKEVIALLRKVKSLPEQDENDTK